MIMDYFYPKVVAYITPVQLLHVVSSYCLPANCLIILGQAMMYDNMRPAGGEFILLLFNSYALQKDAHFAPLIRPRAGTFSTWQQFLCEQRLFQPSFATTRSCTPIEKVFFSRDQLVAWAF